jgi:hypothetical protein
MYTLRATVYPAPPKNAEIRQILEELTHQRQAKGFRAALALALFAHEPCLAVAVQFDDLAALETYRASPLGQPDPRVAALTRQAAKLQLLETVLAVPQSNSPARFVQQVTIAPAAGKGPAAQSLVVDQMKGRQAEGARAGVSTIAAGPDANDLVVTIAFGGLTEFERQRARNRSDAAFQEFVAKLAGLTEGNAAIELFEVLVPFPSR